MQVSTLYRFHCRCIIYRLLLCVMQILTVQIVYAEFAEELDVFDEGGAGKSRGKYMCVV